MEHVLRQTWAFIFRDLHLTRRYMSWVVVFTFYAVVNSATIALIGVAAGDRRLTMILVIGVLLWGFLSVLFNEIANSITYERWEGTLEYTFMAPVSRLTHLFGVSIGRSSTASSACWSSSSGCCSLSTSTCRRERRRAGCRVAREQSGFRRPRLDGCRAAGLESRTRGGGDEYFSGLAAADFGRLLPVEVLPAWLQPLAAISPATYALSRVANSSASATARR